MTQARSLATMPEPRRSILVAIKTHGPMDTAEVAARIGISYEGTRQQIGQLELEGWVTRAVDRVASRPGRPRALFRLTSSGDHLFPKEYDELAVALIDAAAERLGPAGLQGLLEEVVRKKVAYWEPLLAGKSFEERLEALRGIYQVDDPFCRVEEGVEGPRLVELNCPYLEVAQRRPALCSVTVSVLRRLLGRRVVRSERFQDGCGRCVFRVVGDEPAEGEELFGWEPAPP
jgi:predicted ArsR family transcriptional regulator